MQALHEVFSSGQGRPRCFLLPLTFIYLFLGIWHKNPCLRTRVLFSNRWCAAQAALGRVLQHYLNEICLPYGKGKLDEERRAKHQELGEAGL